MLPCQYLPESLGKILIIPSSAEVQEHYFSKEHTFPVLAIVMSQSSDLFLTMAMND